MTSESSKALWEAKQISLRLVDVVEEEVRTTESHLVSCVLGICPGMIVASLRFDDVLRVRPVQLNMVDKKTKTKRVS